MSTTTFTPTLYVDDKDLHTSPSLDFGTLTGEDKQQFIKAETVSILSDTTTLSPATLSFTHTKSLTISAKGVGGLRLTSFHRELQTSIYNYDGSLAYDSTRKTRSSGNCTLTDADGSALIATEYFFGPGRDPVLHLLSADGTTDTEIKTVSRWTSRSHTFLLPDGRSFRWEYKREKGFGGPDKKGTALVLTLQDKRVAALIRNDETRTPGSKSCYAGNGGKLILGEDVGAKDGLSEALVLASCLLMLKKEIDRN